MSMPIDSLKSVPLIVRELLKQVPQIVTKISTPGVALDQKIFADDEVAKVTPIAMESFKHNAKASKDNITCSFGLWSIRIT